MISYALVFSFTFQYLTRFFHFLCSLYYTDSAPPMPTSPLAACCPSSLPPNIRSMFSYYDSPFHFPILYVHSCTLPPRASSFLSSAVQSLLAYTSPCRSSSSFLHPHALSSTCVSCFPLTFWYPHFELVYVRLPEYQFQFEKNAKDFEHIV